MLKGGVFQFPSYGGVAGKLDVVVPEGRCAFIRRGAVHRARLASRCQSGNDVLQSTNILHKDGAKI